MKVIVIILIMLMANHLLAQNTNLGTGAGKSGTANTSIGYYAGDIVDGEENTFLGYYAGKQIVNGYRNVFLGAYAGFGNSNVGPGYNVFIGYESGYNIQLGYSNVFIGDGSGYSATTAASNNFVGKGSGGKCITCKSNVFIGNSTGYQNLAGEYNTYIGNSSGSQAAGGSRNVFVGYQAGYNESGSNKLYIESSNAAVPLIYGDFALDRLGINSLPNSTHTLTVGGTIHATGIYVNGQSISGDLSFWNRNGSNIYPTSTADNVGIGVILTPSNNPNSYKLAVKGKIGAQEVQIENTSITWSDFVFYPDYKLRPLYEVESFIKQNGHLPEIPSEKEVRQDGIKLAEMDAKLLQKIEELTLYLIDLKRELDSAKSEIENLKKAQN